MKIIIVTDCELSKPTGDTIRILSLTSELAKNGFAIDLVALKPHQNLLFDLGDNVTLHYVKANLKYGLILNLLKKTWLMNKEVRSLLKTESATLYIETSPLAGYFALIGFSNYVVDVHGICFEEVGFSKLPFYIPHWLHKEFTQFVEKLAVSRAKNVVVVSNPMKNFVVNKWNVAESKITVVPNGYFGEKIKKYSTTLHKSGMVSFVGMLTKWAAVEKVINAANILKDSKAVFYIVGDGPFRGELEHMVKRYNLSNVIFTGLVPIDRAYEIIAQSEVCLLPFPKSLCTEVAYPIKVLEYMALGKAIVMDNVSELATFLGENRAALVCKTDDDTTFANNIKLLLDDTQLLGNISNKAKDLASNLSWKMRGDLLASIFKNDRN